MKNNVQPALGLLGVPTAREIPGVRALSPASLIGLTADATQCPPWCRTTQEQHAHEDPGFHLHEGPEFGMLRTWFLDSGTATFIATLPAGEEEQPALNAEALRQLSDEALAAARWLEQEADAVRHGRGPSIPELVMRAHQSGSTPAKAPDTGASAAATG